MNSDNDNNPTLIIMRGLPGSGKSHLADELVKSLNKPSVVLDPDKIDFDSPAYINFTENLKKENVAPKLFPYRYLRSLAYGAIENNETVIWTQAFTNQDLLDRTIKNLSNYTSELSLKLKVLIVEVNIDENTARIRTKKREEDGQHGVDEDNFKRFINDYDTFESYGYDLVSVDGKNDVLVSVKTVLEKLYSF